MQNGSTQKKLVADCPFLTAGQGWIWFDALSIIGLCQYVSLRGKLNGPFVITSNNMEYAYTKNCPAAKWGASDQDIAEAHRQPWVTSC